jgi:hypothetical protein
MSFPVGGVGYTCAGYGGTYGCVRFGAFHPVGHHFESRNFLIGNCTNSPVPLQAQAEFVGGFFCLLIKFPTISKRTPLGYSLRYSIILMRFALFISLR